MRGFFRPYQSADETSSSSIKSGGSPKTTIARRFAQNQLDDYQGSPQASVYDLIQP